MSAVEVGVGDWSAHLKTTNTSAAYWVIFKASTHDPNVSRVMSMIDYNPPRMWFCSGDRGIDVAIDCTVSYAIARGQPVTAEDINTLLVTLSLL